MAGCITDEYRDLLKGLSKTQCGAGGTVIEAVLATIPRCDSSMFQEAAEKAERAAPTPWGATVSYVGSDGKKQDFNSPSAAVRALGLPVSGSVVCKIPKDPREGVKCSALDVIEILRLNNYVVWGDGKDTPVVKGKTTHMTIFHPNAPK
jgi:hypothetical protein